MGLFDGTDLFDSTGGGAGIAGSLFSGDMPDLGGIDPSVFAGLDDETKKALLEALQQKTGAIPGQPLDAPLPQIALKGASDAPGLGLSRLPDSMVVPASKAYDPALPPNLPTPPAPPPPAIKDPPPALPAGALSPDQSLTTPSIQAQTPPPIPIAAPPADDRMNAILGLARKDSGGNYNALTYLKDRSPGGTADLQNMTIQQVMDFQKQMPSMGHASTALGGYQMIAPTLQRAVQMSGVDPATTKFDQSTQDLLASQLVKARGYDDFAAGKISPESFAQNLSKEWAILPKDASGAGSYDGFNGNRSGVKWDTVLGALNGKMPDGATAVASSAQPQSSSAPRTQLAMAYQDPETAQGTMSDAPSLLSSLFSGGSPAVAGGGGDTAGGLFGGRTDIRDFIGNLGAALLAAKDRRRPFEALPEIEKAQQQQALQKLLMAQNLTKDQRDFQFRTQESQRAQQNADRSYKLQEQNAAHSGFQNVTRADGSIWRIGPDGTATQVSGPIKAAEPPKIMTGPKGNILAVKPDGSGYTELMPGEAQAPTTKVIKQSDGSEVAVQWDPDTKDPKTGKMGVWAPMVAPEGGNAVTKPQKLTEQQSKDMGFYNRGSEADKILLPFEGALASPIDNAAGSVPGVGNFMVSKEYQQGQQAGREFLASILRKDSGAAITKEEEANYGRMYLPRPGDAPEVIAQKRESRARAMEGIKMGLGPAEIVMNEFKAKAEAAKPGAKKTEPKVRVFNMETGNFD